MDSELWQAAVRVQKFLGEYSIPNCIIGGVALGRWGQPRETLDVDATLVVPFGDERVVAETILRELSSRIENPIEFALRARILLLTDSHGFSLDLSIGGLPFEERMLGRSSLWTVSNRTPIRTCSAEDLVVLKSFAARPQDWIDVENVIIRQGGRLDRQLITDELKPLAELKEEPELLARLNEIFRAHPTS